MNKNIIAIIDCNTYSNNLHPLTVKRSAGCIPILGKYRLIDFTLSSLVNCGCTNVALYPGQDSRSLHDHIENGSNWGLNTNRDGIFIHETELGIDSIISYNVLKKYLAHLNRSKQDHVIIGHASCVHHLDFGKYLDAHLASQADISVLKKDHLDLGFYILSRSLLLDLIQTSARHYEVDLLQTIVRRKNLHINTLNVSEPFSLIDSVLNYYNISMKLINEPQMDKISRLTNLIYTKKNFSVPTTFSQDCVLKNSLIAGGCEINCIITGSILFRKVKLGHNSKLINTIVMANVQIGDNVVLENVIVDKNAVIKSNVQIIAPLSQPIFIAKGQVVENEDSIYS